MMFSRGDARALLLAAQGLNPRLERPAGKADVLGAVRRMAVLQIDSISVVARSPYLVLWSRLGPYEPRWLDELLAEGKLDRKSTRLNSSHANISYAVFCLKKKTYTLLTRSDEPPTPP